MEKQSTNQIEMICKFYNKYLFLNIELEKLKAKNKIYIFFCIRKIFVLCFSYMNKFYLLFILFLYYIHKKFLLYYQIKDFIEY